MKRYTEEDLATAKEVIASLISECDKMLPRYPEGTAQHTLLKNRIKALLIPKALMPGENAADKYTEPELTKALPPIISIRTKCEKALPGLASNVHQRNRLEHIIKAMRIAESLLITATGREEQDASFGSSGISGGM